MRRVVVTGLGVVAPNGIGKEAFWEACRHGQSGVGPIRSFDASKHPVKIAAEVPNLDVAEFLPPSQRKNVKSMSRSTRFAVASAGLALHDGGLDMDEENPERVGVVMGATAPAEAAAVRAAFPALPFLMPGIGRQGGDVEAAVRAAFTGDPASCLIAVAAAIMFADDQRSAAVAWRDRIRRAAALSRSP